MNDDWTTVYIDHTHSGPGPAWNWLAWRANNDDWNFNWADPPSYTKIIYYIKDPRLATIFALKFS